MPVRIYALAKDLKIDSKDLVDICAKVGITGKGSALASLDDDEVVKLKSYLSGGSKKVEKPVAEKVVAVVPAPPPVVVVVSAATATVVAPPPPVERETFTRDDYLATSASNKIRVISSGRAKPTVTDANKEAPADTEKFKQKRREPVISLAKMPTAKQPTMAPKSSEPTPQRPDIRLPKDAIAGSRAGNRAPLEHLTKTLTKPEAPAPKKPGGSRSATAAPSSAPLSKGPGKKGKGDKPATSEEAPGLLGMASSRADRQKARKTRMLQKQPTGREEDESGHVRRGKTLTRKGNNTAAPRREKAVLELPCSMRTFSEAAGVPVAQVLKALMGMGMSPNINSQIDANMAEVLSQEFGLDLTFEKPPSLEESLLLSLTEQADDPETLVPRPPVITFLGHVDHGKTSLLDRIIGIAVAAGEAGGITQHIRAYQVEKAGRKISFVDTPGHEAFTEMRARGAHVTDIAVLVVAADDGVMPQTEEAISHAKAAGVPIVVALNKIDLRGTDINRVMQQLATQNLLPSEWGGDTEVVQTSATTGDGIDQLIETLFGIAELHEFKANPPRPGIGTCLEAEQQGDRGVMAKLIVQNGTLRVGDVIVCGSAYGRVKAIYDTLKPNQRLDEAGPSMPVNITGLSLAPAAGEKFFVLDDIGQAREIAEKREERVREQGLSSVTPKVSFEKFQQMLSEGRVGKQAEITVLNLIIRADVRGSLEAIQKELGKLLHPEVQIHVLQYSVGGITTADVALANASDAVVVGFNVIPDESARQLAEKHSVEIRRYEIIYKLTEDIKLLLEGKLKPEERIVEMGRALVKQVFAISRIGVVAGCYIAQGNITRGCRIRVNRDGRTIGDYALDSLRREKDDVREVQRGMECGIRLVGFNDVKKDDILEAYRIEEVARTL